MPKVSIIVPNYNHARFLDERLTSIFNQTFQDFEVILLDDASTDQSVSILKKYAAKKNVTHLIINETNTGSPFIQWKKGLELAKGEYIWIAESDDSCESNFLEQHMKLIDAASLSVAKVMLLQNEIKTEKEINHPAFENIEEVTLLANHFTVNCPFRNISSSIFKKINSEDIQQSTFWKYNIIGDFVFYYEFFLNKKAVFNSNAINYFRKDGTGLSSIKSKDLQYYQKYFNEHVSFISLVFNQNEGLLKTDKMKYIKRKFNKIRNRTTFNKKLSLLYLKIYLKYQFQKLV
jgi:glycosyltransferase involved in cell wall biosynthesis